MEKIDVRGLSSSYQILIEEGILDQVGLLSKEVLKARRVLIISDQIVADLYMDRVEYSLENSGFEILKYIIKPGEESKSISNLEDICEYMAQMQMGRSDAIIALGGGVVGDLAGFVASSYMRGIDFIQVPTTLLSQVDSSVGGKVAINLKGGKNLLGSFYNPKRVIIDPMCLLSLDSKYLKDGIAEVIKYGCIFDKDLFEFLEQGQGLEYIIKNSKHIIKRCCSIKKEIVQKDELDTGIRMILNFGHTIGHAIEAYYNYQKYTHGYAISIGMVLVSKYAQSISENNNENTKDKIIEILKRYGLPYDIEKEDLKKIVDYIKRDKKIIDNRLNLILVNQIGKATIQKIDLNSIEDFVKRSF